MLFKGERVELGNTVIQANPTLGNNESIFVIKDEDGNVLWDLTDEQLGATVTFSGANSFQPIWVDLTLGAGAGSSVAGDTAHFAPFMGNVFGTNLTDTQNYIGGLIGKYSIDGTNASTYPVGGVLGIIGDLTTTADGAFVAVLDGDSGVTSAGAAFKVMYNNSTASSKFNFGADLSDAAHDGFNAVSYTSADIKFSAGTHVISGSRVTRANVEADFPAAPIGSIYVSSGAGGRVYVKVADAGAATDWERVTTSAAD